MNNQRESPFGAGWTLKELSKLHALGGSALITNGDGSAQVYSPAPLGSGSFVTSRYAVGDEPRPVASGDSNLDRFMVFMTANFGDDSVTVFLGRGGGRFGGPIEIPDVFGPKSLAVADLDVDGILDFVVSLETQDSVAIYLGDGEGSYELKNTITVGDSPGLLVMGDMDMDGVSDISVVNESDNTVSILISDGLGGVATSITVGVGDGTHWVATNDFDGDDVADIAVSDSADGTVTVTVIFSDGFGGVATSTSITAGAGPGAVDSADYNGDGFQDIAVVVTQDSDRVIRVLLGDGSGGFSADGNSDTAVTDIRAMVSADVESDGNLDLLTKQTSESQLRVMLGNGDGTFQLWFFLPVGSEANSMALADFNGDSRIDAVVADSSGDSIAILVSDGKGKGDFTQPNAYAVGVNPISSALGDVKSDGRLAAVVSNAFGVGVSVMLGDGCGALQEFGKVSVDFLLNAVALADINEDSNLDIVVLTLTKLWVAFGDGIGNFTVASDVGDADDGAGLAVGDFDEDEHLDVAIANGGGESLTIFFGDGAGAFPSFNNLTVGSGPAGLVTVDLDADGSLDLVVVLTAIDDIITYLGDGLGGFTLADSAAAGISNLGGDAIEIAVGDLNGDGDLDFVVPHLVNGSASGDKVSVLLGDGAGGIGNPKEFVVGLHPRSVVLEDFNGDGFLDIATANRIPDDVTVITGDGLGGFGAPTSFFAAFDDASSVSAGDFVGDGVVDLLTTNLQDPDVEILLGIASGQLILRSRTGISRS